MQNSVAKKLFAVGSAVAMTVAFAAPLAVVHASVHSAGTNVVSSDGTVWMIMPDGTRRAYTSAGAFLSYGFNSWSQVVPASSEDLALTQGSFIPPQDGSIMCSDRGTDKGTCYEVSNSQKFGFTSAAVFAGLGFSFSNALYGDVSWMTSGSTLINDATAAHLPGTLVNNNGTVQLIGNGGVLGIPDLNTFNGWGYSFKLVVPANANDKMKTQTGVMAVRTPGLLSPISNGTTGCTSNCNPPVTVGPVSVALASTNPASSQIVQGQVAAPVAAFTFNGNGTVTAVNLQRIGVSSNNLLKNVYLYNGAQRLTDAASVNSTGGISFANGSNLFTVSGSMTVTVMADIICGTSACGTPYEADSGQTVGVQLTGVTLAGSMVASGVPVSGNLFNVSSAPSLASVQVSGLTPANGTTPSVNPGPSQVVWQANFNVANTNVNLTRLALREVGSVYSTDVQNFILKIDGTQLAQSQTMNSNNYVTLAPATPFMLTTGAHTVQVLADVVSGANRTFGMTLQQNADVGLVDTSYNVGVAISGSTVPPIAAGVFTVNSVNNGSFTLQVASSSPSTSLSYNTIGAKLASWVITTYGEPIKISTLNVGFNYATGTTNSNANATLRNGYLTINGAQYGSSQSVPCTSSTGISGTAGTLCASNSVASTGTAYQTNYIVQPGQPIVVSFIADLYDNDGTGQLGNGDTITARLFTGVQNAQGQTSLVMTGIPASASPAYPVTVTTGTISGVKNGVYGNQTTVAPQNNLYKIGSFYVNGSSVEAVNINSVNVTFASSGQASILTNVQLSWNGTMENQVKGTVVYSSNTWTVNHQIPMNGSALVEVYANILSGGTTTLINTSLQATGLTVSSGQSADTGTIPGQAVSLGNGSINVTQDASTPFAGLVLASQSAVPVAAFKFAASNDMYNITDLTFTIASTTTPSQFYVYAQQSTCTGVSGACSTSPVLVLQKSPGSGTLSWSSLSIPVPNGGTTILTVKVDVGLVGTGAGTSGDNLQVSLTSAKATGSNGTNAAVPGTTVSGNTLYVYKAIPTVVTDNSVFAGVNTATLNVGTQTLYQFKVSAGANPVSWNQVKFFVSTSTGITGITGFTLYDASNNQSIGTTTPTVTTVTGGMTVYFPTTLEQQVSTSKSYYLQATVAGSLSAASVSTNIQHVATTIATPASSMSYLGSTSSFVWSDMSASSHTISTSDWNNDYLVQNLPTQSLNLVHN